MNVLKVKIIHLPDRKQKQETKKKQQVAYLIREFRVKLHTKNRYHTHREAN